MSFQISIQVKPVKFPQNQGDSNYFSKHMTARSKFILLMNF